MGEELNKNEQVELEEELIPVEIQKSEPKEDFDLKLSEPIKEKKLISCLRNEKVIVKFIPREGGLVNDPRHILYGGLGINSKRKFVVPMLQSEVFVNVLTNDEKDFLESIMGLPQNALSVYLKQNNYWENRGVVLGKENKILDLSNPEEYIDYKILLANKDFIAPSEEELKRYRKATYQYVLTREGEELEASLDSLNTTSKAYMLYGEIKDNLEKLALVVELGTGKKVSSRDKKPVYTQVDRFIRANPSKFISVMEDEYLETKLLINKAVETGYIRKRGHYYYLTEGNKPLCNEKQEPTLQSACEYLNSPKYQEVKFTLEAQIKD